MEDGRRTDCLYIPLNDRVDDEDDVVVVEV